MHIQNENFINLFFKHDQHKQKVDEIITYYSRQFQQSNRVVEKYILYELVAYIHEHQSKQKISDILEKEIHNPSLFFHHSIYSDIKKILSEETEFLEKPIEVEDGVIQCSKCKSYKTVSYAKQTRASDEGTSVFVSCAVCKHKFRL